MRVAKAYLFTLSCLFIWQMVLHLSTTSAAGEGAQIGGSCHRSSGDNLHFNLGTTVPNRPFRQEEKGSSFEVYIYVFALESYSLSGVLFILGVI